jgi:hypothetical protein
VNLAARSGWRLVAQTISRDRNVGLRAATHPRLRRLNRCGDKLSEEIGPRAASNTQNRLAVRSGGDGDQGCAHLARFLSRIGTATFLEPHIANPMPRRPLHQFGVLILEFSKFFRYFAACWLSVVIASDYNISARRP